jgi:hypothetical protein
MKFLMSKFDYQIIALPMMGEVIVRCANLAFPVKYFRNKSNLARIFLNVVNVAYGKFFWLIGSDCLLMRNAIIRLYESIDYN